MELLHHLNKHVNIIHMVSIAYGFSLTSAMELLDRTDVDTEFIYVLCLDIGRTVGLVYNFTKPYQGDDKELIDENMEALICQGINCYNLAIPVEPDDISYVKRELNKAKDSGLSEFEYRQLSTQLKDATISGDIDNIMEKLEAGRVH